MNTLVPRPPFAKQAGITRVGITLTGSLPAQPLVVDGSADPASVAKGGDASYAPLIVAAVLLVAALRQLRKTLAPVVEIVNMVMAAAVAAALVLAAFILVLVSTFTLG